MSVTSSKVFAIALYDNDAETEDELTFRKNDLLQVLECDYMGMEGETINNTLLLLSYILFLFILISLFKKRLVAMQTCQGK